MNEAQTRFDLIDPALRKAGWNVVPGSKIRVEVITAGRIIGKNHKGERVRKKPLSCDYVLEYKGRRLAAIEAKARDKYYTYKVEITNWKERFREVPFALFKGRLFIFVGSYFMPNGTLEGMPVEHPEYCFWQIEIY